LGSNYHTLTGNPVHGAMTNIQINHVTNGSAFSNQPTITIDGQGYTAFGMLCVGTLPSPINGLTCYYAGVKVIGNTDVAYQISDLIIQNAEIDGGSDLGITLIGITERHSVTKVGKIIEIPKVVFKVPETKLLGYDVDINTPAIGEEPIGTSATVYTDFFSVNTAEASKFTLQVEPVTLEKALFLNDDDGLNPQIKTVITSDLGTNLENNGGYIEVEFIKDSARHFGGIWVDLPSGNFNTFIFINNNNINVDIGTDNIITGIDNTDSFHTLKLIFNGDNTFDILYDGVTKLTNITFGLYSPSSHNNSLFNNRIN